MAIYLITGKLGAGKSLAAVGRIRDALFEGRRVATNLDLVLDKLLPAHAGKPRASDGTASRRCPVSVARIPDKPTVADLEALGPGNETMDETKNGILVLDELASWLNAREWANKQRQEVIDWLVHSRKKGWDVFFIAQHLDQIDKQIRTALVEYLVVCRRMDRLKVPFVGKLISVLTSGLISGNLPKMHVATVKYGVHPESPVADRWVYLAHDLYAAYDTRQVFSDRYSHGLYTYLPPWHTKGRYQQRGTPIVELVALTLQLIVLGPFLPFVAAWEWLEGAVENRRRFRARKLAEAVIARRQPANPLP